MTPLETLARWQAPPYSDVQADLRCGKLPQVDLRGDDFEGRALPGARDLRGIDLRGAKVGAIDLSRAWLQYARLDGASLEGARLSGAWLVFASAAAVRLDGARLDGASLEWSNFAGAKMTRADLRYANLHGAVLAGADLRAVNARGVNWRGCDHEGAMLFGAARDRTPRAARECYVLGHPSFAELFDALSWRGLAWPQPSLVPFIEGIVWSSPNLDGELRALLDGNGQSILTAICTLLLVAQNDPAPYLDTLWIHLQSWYFCASQIAVALYLLDSQFDARARRVLAHPNLDDRVREPLTVLLDGGARPSIAARFLAKMRALARPSARARWVR